jgi:hypothetical protein
MGGSIFPEATLDYVPRGCIGESHVVQIAHLLGLQIYTGSFETGWQREMVCHFSQGRHSLGLGSVQWGIGWLSTG